MGEEKLSINEKLALIQFKLKANRGQYNKFGNYSYRSCEDILEAVKPLLNEHDCTIIISDELVLIGDRYYIKATAMIQDNESNISSIGYAREPEIRKGMDAAQVTGASSSYSRKYALNGLFAIDDTKDADTMDNRSNTQGQPAHMADDTYVVGFGKYNGKTFDEIGKDDVVNYAQYLKSSSEKSEKPMSQQTEQFLDKARAWMVGK